MPSYAKSAFDAAAESRMLKRVRTLLEAPVPKVRTIPRGPMKNLSVPPSPREQAARDRGGAEASGPREQAFATY